MMFVLLLSLAPLVSSSFCQPTIHGKQYDFTSLASDHDSYKTRSSDEIYEYVLNICDEVHDTSECDGSICQLYDNYLMEVLGYWTESQSNGISWQLMDESDPHKGVTAVIANGEPCFGFYNPRIVNVDFVCNPGIEIGEFSVLDDTAQDACSSAGYSFSIESCHGCVGGCGGTGYGDIFLIVMGVIIFVYVGGGVLWNHKKNEMPLRESLPNQEFWSAFPGYVKDGCVFSYGKAVLCMGCAKSKLVEGYQRVSNKDDDDLDEENADLLDDEDGDLLDE